MTQSLVLATNNLGKIAEIELALRDLSFRLLPQDHFSLLACDEPGLTFVENAIIKARYACANTHLPALADDSGLVVPALQGEPGIYSARYASDPQACLKKLLDKLADTPHAERAAYFYCCLVFMRHAEDPTPIIAEGYWHGLIAFEPKGSQGFGYDPLFYIPELLCTAAELSLEEKNRLSHRAQALQILKTALNASSPHYPM